jgi:SAM-dependent methyltransferase
MRYRRFLRPPLTYKTKRSRNLVDEFVASYPADALILNVGAGETRYGPNVLNLEIEPGPTADVVGVAERLPVRDASCDGLILMAVLEHVADEQETLTEAARVLRPGGRLLVDVPFLQGYHASPADYRRYTEQGLRAELERHGFDVEGSGVAVGPGSAAAWIASEFLALLISGRSARAYRLARLATAWLALPLKYADAWLERHPMAYVIPSAVWAIGRRPQGDAATSS